MEDRRKRKRQRSLGSKVMFQVGWLTAGPASGESRMARGVDARESGRDCFGALQHDGGLSGAT